MAAYDYIEYGSISGYRHQKRINGFVPEELVRSGALSCVPCRRNDLINPVHPIFRYENFINCDRKVYDELLPAFRLATNWLMHSACRYFWTTLLWGRRVIDTGKTMELGQLTFRISRFNMKPTEQNSRLYELYLNQLASRISFTFSKRVWHDHSAYGLASFPVTRNLGAIDNHPWSKDARVLLMHDFYTQAAKLASLQYPDEAMRLRFHFFTAVNVCHELSHCIEAKTSETHLMKMYRDHGPKKFDALFSHLLNVRQEAIFEDQKQCEIGRAFEEYFFGGTVQPINYRCDALDGLFVYTENQVDPLNTIAYSIPMGYIEEQQQQDFWDRLKGKRVPRDYFRIPKVGAAGMRTSTTSTRSLRSWLQDREENLTADKDVVMDDTPNLKVSQVAAVQTRFVHGTSQLIRERPALRCPPSQDVACTKVLLLENEQMHTTSCESECLEQGQRRLSECGFKPASNSTASSAPGEEEQDIAQKGPGSLTVADKWKLTEEYFCLVHKCSPLTFLSLRAAGRCEGLPENLTPRNKASWQKAEIDMLVELRFLLGREWRSSADGHARDARIAMIAQKWEWCEELAVYNGETRLSFYQKRAGADESMIFSRQFSPILPSSWGEEEQNMLEEKRKTFADHLQKWNWFEEFVKLEHGVSRQEFLERKHQGLFNFRDFPLLDPGNPHSWGVRERDNLKRLRQELSPLRRHQKWKWLIQAWVLQGRSIPDWFFAQRDGSLWQVFLKQHPEWDPDNVHSWQTHHVETLLAEIEQLYAATDSAPANSDMVQAHKEIVGKQDRLITSYFKVTTAGSSGE